MDPVELSIGNVGDLDFGRVGESWNQALRRVLHDIEDRPRVDKPRKLTLEIAFVPVTDESGHCYNAAAQAAVTDSLPRRRSGRLDFAIRQGNKAVFRPEAPDNVAQQTLPLDESGDQD